MQRSLDQSGDAEIAAVLTALDGRFVAPGPSGAPTRGRPDVLPTGRNFYSVDVRGVPTAAAWALGRAAADALALRYFQDAGEWPRSIAFSAWATSNMRTGGDDVAQVMALIGAEPVWEPGTGRVTGFRIIPLSELGRPRIDVTMKISGMFRDAFPGQIDLIDSAIRAVAALDEDDDANPIAAARRSGTDGTRIFGAKPGAYGAGMQALIDEGIWDTRKDFADAFLAWGGYAYGGSQQGDDARARLAERLAVADAVFQAQDNREHDILDSDDYYQFMGGLAATVETLKGSAPRIYHGDHSRPEKPVTRSLGEEIARVVRGRAANPKWIAGMMRHGYKGAFEMAATVDYLFAFAATTNAVQDHHFDQLFDAYIADANGARLHRRSKCAGAGGDGGAVPGGDRSRALVTAVEQRLRSAVGADCRAQGGGRMKDMSEADLDARHAEKMRKKKAARDKIIATKTIEKGLLIVHTGKGKGKSTAAFGMIFRALGHGMPVAIVQFVKGKWQTGERVALEKFGDLVSINTMGEGFTWETQDRQRDLAAARAAWERAKAIIAAGEHKVVLLDELNIVLRYDYLPVAGDRRLSAATRSRRMFMSSSRDAMRRRR